MLVVGYRTVITLWLLSSGGVVGGGGGQGSSFVKRRGRKEFNVPLACVAGSLGGGNSEAFGFCPSFAVTCSKSIDICCLLREIKFLSEFKNSLIHI